MTGDELVEVVGLDGAVQRIVTRAEMRRDRLRHRCTYLVVVDAADRVVVHRRAAWKDVWPGAWDLAFGGVVTGGEEWADAAARELAEEAGITAPIEEVGGGTYDDADVSLLGRMYRVRHDGPYTFPTARWSSIVAYRPMTCWPGSSAGPTPPTRWSCTAG